MAENTGWLLALVFYLFFVTFAAGTIIYEKTGEEGIETANIGEFNPYISGLNFTDMGSYNFSEGEIQSSSNWAISETKGFYTTDGYPAYLYFIGVKDDDDENYDYTYTIKNPDDGWVQVIIWQYKSLITSQGLWVSIYEDYIIVEYWDSIWHEKIEYPCNIDNDGYTIRTVYNPNTGYLKVYLDDILICEDTFIDENGRWVDTHMGLNVEGNDIELMEIEGNFVAGEGDTNSIWSFLGIIAKLLVINVDEEYLPWFLNVLLIKIPLIGLIKIGADWIRGTG